MSRTGVTMQCPMCGATFYRIPAEVRSVNYCSYRCSGLAAVARGSLPPCPKGERRSPGTEFKKGELSRDVVPLGSVSVRTHSGDSPRAWVKVGNPNVWRPRAQVVWENHHGEIPVGSIIHHEDEDTLNDAPDNLRCLTRAEHARHHHTRSERMFTE